MKYLFISREVAIYQLHRLLNIKCQVFFVPERLSQYLQVCLPLCGMENTVGRNVFHYHCSMSLLPCESKQPVSSLSTVDMQSVDTASAVQ